MRLPVARGFLRVLVSLRRRSRAWRRPALPSWEGLKDQEASQLLVAGIGVGVLGGLAAVLFDHGMSWVGGLLLGTAFPARDAPTPLRAILGPTVAGLGAGMIVRHLSRRRRPQGMADVLARVQLDEPTLSLREGSVSAVAAALAVGGGFSGGREGPIVQFASTLAARACRVFGVRPGRQRTLVAAGAAAGIAASFNTPLGGAFFALEIILGNFAVESFAPVVAATVSGTVVGQALLGDRVALRLPPFAFHSTWELPLYLCLGAIGALVAHGFKRAVVDGAAWIGGRMPDGPARPMMLGLGVGCFAAAGLHPIMGNGYGFMEQSLRADSASLRLLCLLLAAKVLATSLTVAGRTGAGLFAPSLFVGCVTGQIFGLGSNQLWPDRAEAIGAYGIVGMGSVTAAVLGAPITLTLMLFEMTGNYHVILPLMAAVAASGVVSGVLGSRSLEELELAKEGLSLDRARDGGALRELQVGDLVQTHGFEVLPEDTPLPKLVSLFLRRRVEEVYLVDLERRYVGTVHLQDVKHALADPTRPSSMRPSVVGTARRGEAVADVLDRFFDAPGDCLPVVDEEGRLLGVISERDVVAAYQREGLRKDARLAHVVSRDSEGDHDDYLELPPGQLMDVLVVGPARAGRTLRELGLPRQHHCTVVAMSVWDEKAGDWIRLPVDADHVLRAEDRLIVLGPASEVRRLLEPPTA